MQTLHVQKLVLDDGKTKNFYQTWFKDTKVIYEKTRNRGTTEDRVERRNGGTNERTNVLFPLSETIKRIIGTLSCTLAWLRLKFFRSQSKSLPIFRTPSTHCYTLSLNGFYTTTLGRINSMQYTGLVKVNGE